MVIFIKDVNKILKDPKHKAVVDSQYCVVKDIQRLSGPRPCLLITDYRVSPGTPASYFRDTHFSA